MKKNYEKKRHFVRNYWLRLLIIVELCILFLTCSMTPVSADPVFSGYIKSGTTLNGSGDLTNDQQSTVTGIIKDGSTGNPMPGVTVMVKGTAIGVLSDVNGRFSITIPGREAILIFSFVGFQTQEIPANAGMSVNVTMSIEVTQISEVVVVGYGVQKKESVVGAITQVDNTALVKSGVPTITNAIAGKLSGVLTLQQTGEPGLDYAEIVIRGLSSWNTSAPLVLVDGVERDFKALDPNEINTISVLKDASATAVFGARGANGVIIVTTKRGLLGKAKMDFSSSYGIDIPTRIPDHISSYTTMSMLNVALMNQQQFTQLTPQKVLEEYRNPSTPLNALRYPDVDWFAVCTKPFAPTTNANLSISGGTNFVKYFSSFGYLYQGTFVEGYKKGYHDSRYQYNKFNYRTNLDFTLTRSTQLSLNVGGDIEVKNIPPTSLSQSGIWPSMYGTSECRFPAYFPDWVLEQVPDPDYPDDSGIRLAEAYFEVRGNPYTWCTTGTFYKYIDSKLFTDLYLDQKLDFVTKGLSARGKVSLSTFYRDLALYTSYDWPQYQLIYENIGTSTNPWKRLNQGAELIQLTPVDLSVGGVEAGYYSDLYYEMSLNYSNSFGKHNVTGLALMNRQQRNIGTDFPYYNEGLVGRVTYDYNRKYLLEINIGYTGSERFAPGNRFGFFPSGAIGWVISEEPFFKNSMPWMNRFKLRYSDGLVGSDYAANRWLYISNFTTDSRGNIWEDPGANINAQWEEARKRDLGIEFGFKNGLGFSVDLFDEQREKMILTPRSVTFVVGNLFKDLNLGRLKKHGIELEANYNKAITNDLDIYAKAILGLNENRILFKDDPIYTPEYAKEAGKPLGAARNGQKLIGPKYYNTIDEIHMYTSPVTPEQLFLGEHIFLDYDASGSINSLDKFPIKGIDYPPVTYSFSSGFRYKGFEFNFMFQGNLGKYVVYNLFYEYEFCYSSLRLHSSQLDYWRPDNPDASHSTLHYTGDAPKVFAWAGGTVATVGLDIALMDNQYWRNADYLRLKEVYAGYTFRFRNRVAGISDLNIFMTGYNLWTLTGLIEGDPERKDFKLGFYPIVASLKLGAKISF